MSEPGVDPDGSGGLILVGVSPTSHSPVAVRSADRDGLLTGMSRLSGSAAVSR